MDLAKQTAQVDLDAIFSNAEQSRSQDPIGMYLDAYQALLSQPVMRVSSGNSLLDPNASNRLFINPNAVWDMPKKETPSQSAIEERQRIVSMLEKHKPTPGASMASRIEARVWQQFMDLIAQDERIKPEVHGITTVAD